MLCVGWSGHCGLGLDGVRGCPDVEEDCVALADACLDYASADPESVVGTDPGVECADGPWFDVSKAGGAEDRVGAGDGSEE